MLRPIRKLDLKVMEFFAGVQHPLLKDSVANLGSLSSPTNTLIFLIFSYYTFPRLFYEFLTALFVTWSTVYLLKFIVSRERPKGNLEAGITHSFPSAHSATAFVAAGLLSQIFVSTAPLLYFIAGLIALSRVYLQTHYLSDVVSGSIIGITIFLLII